MKTSLALDIAQRTYDHLSPYDNEITKPDLLDDEEKTLELAYEYISSQDLTSSDIEELDRAILALPSFLENLKKWNEKKEGL